MTEADERALAALGGPIAVGDLISTEIEKHGLRAVLARLSSPALSGA